MVYALCIFANKQHPKLGFGLLRLGKNAMKYCVQAEPAMPPLQVNSSNRNEWACTSLSYRHSDILDSKM